MKDSKNSNSALVAMLAQIDETLKQVIIGTGAVIGIANAVKELSKSTETNKETDLGIALELTEESKKKFEELKSQIINTANEITENYKKELTDTETNLINVMGKDYVAKSDFGEYKAEIETEFEQTAENIRLEAENSESIQNELSEYKKTQSSELVLQHDAIINEIQESFMSKDDGTVIEELISSSVNQSSKNIIDNFTSKLSVISDDLQDTTKFINEINAYIKRGELESGVYGIEIGRSDSNIKARFTNEKLSFLQGTTEVAYISGNNLYILRAEILDYIKIGTLATGYFIFDVTDNGLEVTWSYG